MARRKFHVANNRKAADRIAKQLADKTGKPHKVVKFPKPLDKQGKYGIGRA